MNISYISPRIRGPAGTHKSTFTFKNNATPGIRQRIFRPPQQVPSVISPQRYGMPRGLQTPILNNELAPHYFSPYETTPRINNENFESEMDTTDFDSWGLEECIEYENMQREDNIIKRKNSFVYPSKENFNAKKSMHILTSRKENSSPARNFNSSAKSTPMRQTVLSTDAPNGFGFKLLQKEKNSAETLKEENPKLCPKWSPDTSSKTKNKPGDKSITFPRIFTVTVEKLQTWPKVLSCGQMIFELFGIIEKMGPMKHIKGQVIQLKSQNLKAQMICKFYEIDRNLPKLVIGTWHRCIVLLRYNKEYQCISIRSATSNELKYLDKLVIASSKSMAMLLKSSYIF